MMAIDSTAKHGWHYVASIYHEHHQGLRFHENVEFHNKTWVHCMASIYPRTLIKL